MKPDHTAKQAFARYLKEEDKKGLHINHLDLKMIWIRHTTNAIEMM